MTEPPDVVGRGETGRLSNVSVLLVGVLVFLSGCRGCGDGPSEPAVPAAERPLSVRQETCRPWDSSDVVPEAGEDALFVVTQLRFGSVDEGLNLDCCDTPAQCQDDICRGGPQDGASGVDNRLGALAVRLSKLAGSDVQGEMARHVEGGAHPLLVRLRGVDGWSQGGAVTAELSFGLSVEPSKNDGMRTVRLEEPPSRPPSRFSPVGIVDGVLQAGPSHDWMPLFWTRGEIAAVPVQQAYLKASVVVPDGDQRAVRLTSGTIAGAVHVSNLADAILEMDSRTARVLQRLAPVVRALVRRQADLDLVPPGLTGRPCQEDGDCLAGQRCRRERCDEPAHHFESVSFALQLEAVSAAESSSAVAGNDP